MSRLSRHSSSSRYTPSPTQGLVPLEDDIGHDDLEMHEVATKKNEKQVVAEPVVHDIPVQEETLVTWDGPDDPQNPQNFSFRRKCNITFVICALTICTTFASSAPAIASQRLIEQFGVTEEVSDLVTTLFLLGYVTGPIFWGSGSEIFGRQMVLLLSMTVYTILFIGQALATNIETVLILRFLSGTFGVAPLIVSGGLLADIWNSRGRGYAVNLFAGCVFLGPSFGPVVAGFVAADLRLSWGWIYWVLMIFAAACTLAGWLLLPETYAPVLLARKARRLRAEDPIANANLVAAHDKLDKSLRGIASRTIIHPWKMMANEPILILLTVYMALLYGVLYALLEAFPVIFLVHRGFTVTQTGLVFIGIGVGGILTTIINLYFAFEFNKLVPKWKGFPPAEVRLPPAMIGAVMLVLSALWLGWSGFYLSVPWYVPAISTIFVGMSITLIFIAFLVYIVDTYLMLSASALASSTMIRSVVGAAFPLFTTQMYDNLGIQWASTLFACIALLLAPIPFLFYKYGAKIRERSKFAPCFDLKIAKEIAAEEEAAAQEAAARNSSSTRDGKPEDMHNDSASSQTMNPAAIKQVRAEIQSANAPLVESIQTLTHTIGELQDVLHDALSSYRDANAGGADVQHPDYPV